jgi:cell division protein FtsA
MQQPIVALDVGSTKVACAIGLPHERAAGFELLGSSLVAYPTLSEAWMSDPLMVSRAIEQAMEATGVTGDFHRAVVAFNPPSVTGELVRATIPIADEPMAIRAQDLDRLQRYALGLALGIDRDPLIVERLSCSGNGFEGIRDPRGLSATRLSGVFHVVTMPMASRRAIVQAVESAGLEVARLTHTLVAAFEAAADDATRQQQVLLIDVGGLTADIGLFVGGVLSASTFVPSGGVPLAAEIAKRLQATIEQATIWSVEGAACRKAEVPPLVVRSWEAISRAIEPMLQGRPKPDAVLVAGRGSLLDGFAEWIERTIGVPSSVARSGRVSQVADLTRQVGLSHAIGLLELSTRTSAAGAIPSTHFLNRLIDRTRIILTEYF